MKSVSPLSRKTAVVTGGTRGIGKALSLALARQGAHVYALYARDRSAAELLSQTAETEGLAIECLRGDLTDPEKFKEIVETIRNKSQQVDFLLHSAASGVHRKAEDISLKHLRWTFEINVFAFHELVTSLIDRIPAGGRIIAVTSSGGTRVIPYYSAVGASKGALESLMRHYAAEFAPRGIAVNCICPGLVLTEAVEAFPDKEMRVQKALQATPSGQLTTPEDIAAMAQFLCSPQAQQITGQVLVIDGGKTLSS